ncbi:MAG: Ig-like domain repeat protein [Bacilli bacterium]|nr:Ig-like domain repeat protein [Bacilli bacterium]
MKRYLVLIIFTMMICSMKVKATDLSIYLPGGKNYLDENNMIFSSGMMYSDDAFTVKADTDYTLSLPSTYFLDGIILVQIGGVETYINGDISSNSKCVVEQQDVHCTFKTAIDEDALSITVQNQDLISYHNFYGFVGFQLEEGVSSTSYEPYIAPFVDSIDPSFSGSGAYIGSYKDQLTLSEIIQEHIEVVDEIDGNLNDQIVIVLDEYTGNETTLGEYDVELTACDFSNNCSSFHLVIIIKDEITPVISGPTSVNVDAGLSPNIIELINANFTYSDEYDSSCELHILTDEYSPNKQVLGTYLVEFEIVDDSNNKANQSFMVHIEDVGFPVIEGAMTFSSPLSNPLTVNSMISNLAITDNIDSFEDLIKSVTNDTFTPNSLQVGSYSFHISVTDLSGNLSTKTIQVQVVDDIKPNISGPNTYNFSYQENINLQDFMSMLVVSDNVSSLTNSNIYIKSDSFTNRASQVGEFSIIFAVKDEAGNESTHTILITVFDDVAPIIYVDNFIVSVNLSSTFKSEDALKLLINSNELASGNYTTLTLIDEYAGNEENPGSYLQKYRFTNEQGEEFEKEFIVKVVGDDQIHWNKELLIRNLIIYPIVIGICAVVVVKIKK